MKMTSSDIVTVTVEIAAPKIEITNVEFTAISPSSSPRTMQEKASIVMRA